MLDTQCDKGQLDDKLSRYVAPAVSVNNIHPSQGMKAKNSTAKSPFGHENFFSFFEKKFWS